jgi:biotin carboxyl carrier protein
MVERYLVRSGDDEASLELKTEDGRTLVRREDGEHWYECELSRVGESGLYVLMLDNAPTEVYIERRRGGAVVTIGRHILDYDVGPWRPESARAKRGESGRGVVKITAPMTGSIVEVRCTTGDQVAAGEVLLVIESMKMNNELRSPKNGTVESVPVVAGQRVKAHELLVTLRTGEG